MNKIGIIDSYLDQGVIFYDSSQFDKAYTCFRKALDLADRSIEDLEDQLLSHLRLLQDGKS